MSTYHDMWREIKKLTYQQTLEWIDQLAPSKGVGVDFFGVRVLGVDLLEALRNWADDHPRPYA